MKKIGNIVITAIVFLSSINFAIALECSKEVEILRLNLDWPNKNSIYFPLTDNMPRIAVDPHENIWISNGNSIKQFSADEGANYKGDFIVKRGGMFSVSANYLFVFNKGPYYYPKYQMNNIVGLVDILKGIDVYERQKGNDFFEIKKSIHEEESIASNISSYTHFVNRDNHLVAAIREGSETFAAYLNEDLEMLDKKKRVYLYKGEEDIFFKQRSALYNTVPKNKRHGLSILDSEEKILNEYYFEKELFYIRNIYGEIVYVENANELLQFDSDGKIKSTIDISCINKKIYKGLYPNKLIGPNEKIYFSEKDNEELVIKYINLKKEDKGQKPVSQKGELE